MMNIRVDERSAYLELEVFGRYDLDRMGEVLNAMRDLAERHGHFSELEIHHGKPDNMIKALSNLSKTGKDSQDYAFLGKLRKYALVSDNPPIILRMISAFSRNGGAEIRIFPMHERDHARQWIEQAAAA